MSLIDLHVDLREVNKQLKRIADALERAYPPPEAYKGEPAEAGEAVTLREPHPWPGGDYWDEYDPRTNNRLPEE